MPRQSYECHSCGIRFILPERSGYLACPFSVGGSPCLGYYLVSWNGDRVSVSPVDPPPRQTYFRFWKKKDYPSTI